MTSPNAKVVTISSDWLRTILKKAKMEWPKELVEYEPNVECHHQWSRHSTNPFCVHCGVLKEEVE